MIALVQALALALASTGAERVLVMPPDGPPSAELAWLGEAVADELPRDLGLLGVPALERHDRMRVQERLGLPVSTRLTRATSIKVAEAIGAWRMVVGSLTQAGTSVSLSLRLLDVGRGTLSAPLMASGSLESLPGLVARLAFDVALGGPTPRAHTREELLAARLAIPFEAWRAHAQALLAADGATRGKLLRGALAIAPGYDEARLDLAREQLGAQEWAEAQKTLAGIAPSSPVARPARFAEGVALLSLGRYAEAASLYGRLREAEPTPAVLANEAIALMRMGKRNPPASELLRQAFDAEPAALDLPLDLGYALLHEAEPAVAAFWLRGVQRRDPRDVSARLLLSWALRQAGRDAEADEEWQALSALTASSQALSSVDLTRRFERTFPSERAVVLDPEARLDAELAASYLLRGERLLEAGDAPGAVAEIARAISLDPFTARGHLLLARARRSRGEVAEAEDALRASLFCREDPATRMELADLLWASGRGPEARSEARRVLEADPGNAAARLLLDGSSP